MSKQAGQNVATAKTKPPAKLPADFKEQVAAKAAEIKKEEAAKVVETTKQNEAIAANKLGTNDAFSVYSDVDCDALQEQALDASRIGEAASRKETQIQVANVLARYHQDKLLGDANPVNLYKLQPDNTLKMQTSCVQLIARHIYEVPEKDMHGRKQALPRHLEARVRSIAPVIYFAITERLPLIWDDEHKALLVPTWMLVSDPNLVPGIWNPETAQAMRMAMPKPQPLDGKDGRNLAGIVKRIEASFPKPAAPRGTNNTSNKTDSDAQKITAKLREAVAANGIEKTLEYVATVFTKFPDDKPFSDTIVELLAVCCEHVNVRNGPGALGKAVLAVSASEPQKSAA